MGKLWSDFKNALLSPLRLAMWVGISLIAGVTGPFGAFSVWGFPTRTLYWALIVGVAIIVVLAARVVFQRLLSGVKYAWISILVSLTLASLLTPLIIVFTRPIVHPDYTGYKPDAQLFFLIFLLALSVDLVRYQVVRVLRNDIVKQTPPDGPRLLERLPKDIRGDILHICGKDHQVEVRT